MTPSGRILSAAAFVLLPPAAAAQAPVNITGRVTSESGAPLGAVTIALPELGLGSLTRDDGTYSLRIPGARVAGQTISLTARRVGYKPKTARIALGAGDVAQDFILESNPLQLGEVVITGAGTSTEVEKLGNVRNSVSPDLIVKSNESNVVQALAGKAPNVQVQQTAGDPGAGSAIQIRGLRTINGSSEPLFIVDGVPMSNTTFSTTNFNPIDVAGVNLPGQVNGGELEGTSAPNSLVALNPDDIENVEILKGASAAAIYGARGERRHSDHDQEGPLRRDEVHAPQLGVRGSGDEEVAAPAIVRPGLLRSVRTLHSQLGSAPYGRADLRPRQRGLRHRPHPRQCRIGERRDGADQLLSFRRLQP
jgi:TonB-dependent SusC/RagA subfamily outer membrane receptor